MESSHLWTSIKKIENLRWLARPVAYYEGISSNQNFPLFWIVSGIPVPYILFSIHKVQNPDSSVSDPHTLNADRDPDPGLWLNTDPGSWIPVLNPNQAKIFLIASFLSFHTQYLAVESYAIFRKTYLKYKSIKAFVSQSHFLYELKKSKLNHWIRIRDSFGIRIPDPDPWGCWIRIQCGSGSETLPDSTNTGTVLIWNTCDLVRDRYPYATCHGARLNIWRYSRIQNVIIWGKLISILSVVLSSGYGLSWLWVIHLISRWWVLTRPTRPWWSGGRICSLPPQSSTPTPLALTASSPLRSSGSPTPISPIWPGETDETFFWDQLAVNHSGLVSCFLNFLGRSA